MNYFKNIIADNEFFDGVDPECIYEASDYAELIQKSCEITDGVLVFNSLNGTEVDGKYRLDLVINETSFNFNVFIYADTVDDGSMMEGLNAILKEVGYAGERRFFNVSGNVLDFGIAFISPEKVQELADNGFLWKDEEQNEYVQEAKNTRAQWASFHEEQNEFPQSQTETIKSNVKITKKHQIGIGLCLFAFLLAKFLPLNGLSTTNIVVKMGFGWMAFIGVIVFSPIPNPSGPEFKTWKMLLNGVLGLVAFLGVMIIGLTALN